MKPKMIEISETTGLTLLECRVPDRFQRNAVLACCDGEICTLKTGAKLGRLIKNGVTRWYIWGYAYDGSDVAEYEDFAI